MNNIRETLKEAFKPRQRNAFSAILIVLILMAVSIAGVLVATGTFFDLADTTSIVEAIDITGQTIYSEQGYVSIQVKNNGNTALDNIYAALLVTTNTGTNSADCAPGTEAMLVTTNLAVVAAAGQVQTVPDLSPGESVTISGSLRDLGDSVVNTAGTGLTSAAGLAVATSNNCAGDLADRGEYILQITGSSGDEIISKTVQIRAQ